MARKQRQGGIGGASKVQDPALLAGAATPETGMPRVSLQPTTHFQSQHRGVVQAHSPVHLTYRNVSTVKGHTPIH